ncbi:uncharacterized protein LOC127380753 [Apus apus]|uniref:uncharacterized protein LOC127380753 n=1 Tax=Apus apus TaxID=8895 RepID=UPI0021F84CB2|nr:uncharacterized protein LOC127380753 [Apus apus]
MGSCMRTAERLKDLEVDIPPRSVAWDTFPQPSTSTCADIGIQEKGAPQVLSLELVMSSIRWRQNSCLHRPRVRLCAVLPRAGLAPRAGHPGPTRAGPAAAAAPGSQGVAIFATNKEPLHTKPGANQDELFTRRGRAAGEGRQRPLRGGALRRPDTGRRYLPEVFRKLDVRPTEACTVSTLMPGKWSCCVSFHFLQSALHQHPPWQSKPKASTQVLFYKLLMLCLKPVGSLKLLRSFTIDHPVCGNMSLQHQTTV